MVWMLFFSSQEEEEKQQQPQAEKETMAGGQKIHQSGQVVLVSKIQNVLFSSFFLV